LVGLDNTHITELRLLETNRFETAELVGKRLVLITDSDRYGGPVKVLKALSGDDVVRSERKYADPHTLTPEAMVLVAANEQIQSTDYTSGLERRRISIPFRHRPTQERQLIAFRRGEAAGEFVPYLPGLLNLVLNLPDADMEQLLRHTTQAVPALREAWTRALVEANDLAHWADTCLVYDACAKTYVGLAKRDRIAEGYQREDSWLYANYRAFAEVAGERRPISLVRFSGLLEDLCQQQLGLKGVGRGRDKDGACLTGVRLRTTTDEALAGLITQAITLTMAKTPASDEGDERVMAKTLGSDEDDEDDGLLETPPKKNPQNPEQPSSIFSIKTFPHNPSSSSPFNTGACLQPSRNPSHPSHPSPSSGGGTAPRPGVKFRNGWPWPVPRHE
jgi:putative DNA primase/helicase